MFLTRQQARDLDRRAMDHLHIPGLVLMENAGRGMAELLLSLGIAGSVVVCCGKGNNGGDGFVIARHLALLGVDVRVLLLANPAELAGDAAVNHAILGRIAVRVDRLVLHDLPHILSRADWIVDALFGSGLQGVVRAPVDSIITAINAAPCRVFAVDIPSGLDSDTGLPLGVAVRAHHTATVVAEKVGFRNEAARVYLGRVHVVQMGVPLEALLGGLGP